MEKAKSMIVGIGAWLHVGSHVEEVCEQVRVGTFTLRLRGEGGRISLVMKSLAWMDGLPC